MFDKYRKKRINKGTHENNELVLFILIILPGAVSHFKGPGMYKSKVKHKKS